MYDYAGLSHQVIAERSDPYIVVDGTNPAQRRLVGDRYVSTYTYAPLGPITRTDGLGDDDPSDDRDHYYLSDAMGGNIGLYAGVWHGLAQRGRGVKRSTRRRGSEHRARAR